jgi:hypothetical protein
MLRAMPDGKLAKSIDRGFAIIAVPALLPLVAISYMRIFRTAVG